MGYSSYIADTAYCGDRTSYSDELGTSINSGFSSSTQYFQTYIDIVINNNPTLLCNEKKDYYTVNDTEIGNGALAYPVTIITSNDVIFAGGVYALANSEYYLYTGSAYWTLSPHKFNEIHCYVGLVNDYGNLTHTSVNNNLDVRPLISLSSSITTIGNGSWSSPYEIIMN